MLRKKKTRKRNKRVRDMRGQPYQTRGIHPNSLTEMELEWLF